jgi:two-component system, NtrC family, sensor kinase
MYDLQKFTLRDMSECGLALRHLGNDAKSMEEVSSRIIQYLYKNLIDKKNNEKASVLIRFFKTTNYRELTPELQEYVQERLGKDVPNERLNCLTLLATAGELAEWNSRHLSKKYKAIPLVSEEAIARLPMMSQLLQQLGLNSGAVVNIDPNLLADLEPKMYNVFYVNDALNSSYIPEQSNFVIPFKVKTVIGFGGLLPSGSVFIVLMFLKVTMPRVTVDLLRPLALNIKLAILPFDNQRIFIDFAQSTTNAQFTITDKDQLTGYLQSQVTTLSQLLDVSEQSTITQSDRLEEAITQTQLTLDSLKKTQIQLIQTEKMSSLGQMVAGVAHEINNPINFIYGNLTYVKEYVHNLLSLINLYQQRFPQNDPEITSLIKAIELEFIAEDLPKVLSSMNLGTERVREIVLSLRNFSRLDEAEVKGIDIHEGIESTLLLLTSQIKKGIEIIKQYGKLPVVECYPAQLNQVFMNILSNAIDALLVQTEQPNKQIVIQTEIVDDQHIQIKIWDNGCGIPTHIQQNIFDPFFTTKPIGQGTGLGLSICYQIIESHHGKIVVTSEPGQGTEFIIILPSKSEGRN